MFGFIKASFAASFTVDMRNPAHTTDQDQFDELRIADFQYTPDMLSSGDISLVIRPRSRMPEAEINQVFQSFAFNMRPERRSDGPVDSVSISSVTVSTAGSFSARSQTELPPPSRFPRRRPMLTAY